MISSNNNSEKKIIALIGIMGSGKTTIGSKLARKLGFYFIDLDHEIEDRKQKSIAQIFKYEGEASFRKIEKEIVKEIIGRDETIVLSLGGGAFMDKEIRELIKRNAISVWLYADLEVLLQRVSSKNTRPLLNGVDKRLTLSQLINKRYPIYKTADIHLDTSLEAQEDIINILANKIKNFMNDMTPKKEVIKVDLGSKSYPIVVGGDIICQIDQYISNLGNYSKIIVITDRNVAKIHLEKLSVALKRLNILVQNIILEPGEKSKSFFNLQNIAEQILENKIDRNSLIVAFGGGVIGDLSGFVASILLRGVDFIQVPTTLLAAVDSSVGGKTAINSKFGKNLIGSFYQPKLVFCDLEFLETLPKRDFICGYAEVVKYGMIKDKSFFTYLDENIEQIKSRNPEVLQKIIVRSCQIKAQIVGLDERENNLRAILNFGHTFGHIFETETGYSNEIFHGEAVAIGMVLAVKMSIELKICDKMILSILTNHLKKIGLSTSPLDIKKSWNLDNLLRHLYKDKKVSNGRLTFILVSDIGEAIIKKDVDEREFLSVMKEVL
jgi:shikimate kinase/3-dehydroquinate synthase